MLAKPADCSPCTLGSRGLGFTTASGPVTSPVLIIGESSGRQEAIEGQPFVGPAGAALKRALRLGRLDQDWFRIANLLWCMPPGNALAGTPWEHDAISHCTRTYLARVLAEDHPVVVTAGALPTRHILNLPRSRHFKIQNFHGTFQRDPSGRFWVVPTFHPLHLQRGAMHLLDTVKCDLQLAVEIARKVRAGEEITRTPYKLTCDPRLDYFRAWADTYQQALAAGRQIDLVVDIETPDSSDKDEDERVDVSWQIVRINFAYNGYEGVTVPFAAPFLEIIREVLASPGAKIFWHAKFDVPRLLKAGFAVGGEWLDYMWAWHVLQSSLPRGLGFVAPFYSDAPPWKHLAGGDGEDQKVYGAFDGFQPHRIAKGITEDLIRQGMWDVYWRHVHVLHRDILDPVEDVGLGLSRKNLDEFGEKLTEIAEGHERVIATLVPEEVCPLEKKDGWKKLSPRLKKDLSGVWSDLVEQLVQVCTTCGAKEVSKTHRCKDRSREPNVVLQEVQVVRYFRRKPFNPRSWQQVLAYIRFKKHKPGKNVRTGGPSTNKDTLDRLMKQHKDPFYRRVLAHRHVEKVNGTYVKGSLKRMDELDRVHPTFTPKPSTLRLAAQNPNTMNVIDDKEGTGDENPAAGFRKCVVAADAEYVRRYAAAKGIEIIHPEPCVLVEADYAGIEAVITGWCANDPEYIRFSHLGVHARLASWVLDRPANPAWSDDDLVRFFKGIKSEEFKVYDTCKRTVHGSNYGLTVRGMVLQFPDLFPTEKIARKYQGMYWEMAPAVQKWQQAVRLFASENGYVGGPGDHPYGYKHRFYDVISFRPISELQASRRRMKGLPTMTLGGRIMAMDLGTDAKKCIAFKPQSIARGVLTETMFRLFDPDETPADGKSYLGDAWFGVTPLRTPVHDSLLLEVPESKVDFVVKALVREMVRPVKALPCPKAWGLGSHLNFGVEVKVGKDWEDAKRGGTMEKVFEVRGGGVRDDGTLDIGNLSGEEHVGVALDLRASPSEEDEFEEEVLAG